ncbi:MAG: hypothetical protein NUW24_06565 [Anaerolineae bacterium]|jgi:hypothetical protein|nr:hypothetical protein [Anaerolineae bacterium]MDH7472778.1 hypothetical protein [Anaerolineae bacterium]
MSTVEYASFLIRLWCEQNPQQVGPTADWCGEIEHIQTGECWTFSTLDELLDFLRWQAKNLDALRRPVGE